MVGIVAMMEKVITVSNASTVSKTPLQHFENDIKILLVPFSQVWYSKCNVGSIALLIPFPYTCCRFLLNKRLLLCTAADLVCPGILMKFKFYRKFEHCRFDLCLIL